MPPLNRVLDIAFKMVPSLPTWNVKDKGRMRWNNATGRPAFGGATGWIDFVGSDGFATEGSEPTIEADAANMGNASTVSIEAGSNDVSGRFTINTAGTGFGAGNFATVTFSTEKADTNYSVFLQIASNDAETLGLVHPTGRTTALFEIHGSGTPLVSKAYSYSYLVIERKT